MGVLIYLLFSVKKKMGVEMKFVDWFVYLTIISLFRMKNEYFL